MKELCIRTYTYSSKPLQCHHAAFTRVSKAPLITCNPHDPMHSRGNSHRHLHSSFSKQADLYLAHPWLIEHQLLGWRQPFKSSFNKAPATVLYWNCDSKYLVLDTLLSEHHILSCRSICSISRTELCKSSNNTLKYCDVETWFINFCLIHGAMPNLIKCLHFVVKSVKLEAVGLSLKLSLKNS